jgi:Putative serine esterase (DUF676)
MYMTVHDYCRILIMATELLRIHETHEAVANVIFVHGVQGDALKTWGDFANDSWPGRLKLDHPELNLYSLGYEADRTAWEGGVALSLPERAKTLLEVLRVEDAMTRPTAFVMHSMGGLVVKQMYRYAQNTDPTRHAEFLEHMRLLIFVATPHQGSDVATWVNFLSLITLPTRATQDLKTQGAHLHDLNEWLRGRAAQNPFPRVEVLYETLKTGPVMVVDQGSANPGLPGVFPVPITADHNGILANDIAYKTVRKAIRQMLGSKKKRFVTRK